MQPVVCFQVLLIFKLEARESEGGVQRRRTTRKRNGSKIPFW